MENNNLGKVKNLKIRKKVMLAALTIGTVLVSGNAFSSLNGQGEVHADISADYLKLCDAAKEMGNVSYLCSKITTDPETLEKDMDVFTITDLKDMPEDTETEKYGVIEANNGLDYSKIATNYLAAENGEFVKEDKLYKEAFWYTVLEEYNEKVYRIMAPNGEYLGYTPKSK